MTREQGKQFAESMASRRDPKPYPYADLFHEFVRRCRDELGAGETMSLGMTNGTNALEHLKAILGDGYRIEEDLQRGDRITVTKSRYG